MADALITALKFDATQVAIYGGITVFIPGVLGELLNTIVFLSLRTFRQNSCAFYLTIMSIVNIGQLFAGLLARVMLYVIDYDGTESSLFYCKFRLYFSHICVMTSLTCFCLATIDQYCATSSNPRFQQLCNIKLAQRLVIIFSFIWAVHGIPYAVLYYHSVSSTTGKVSCVMTNTIYLQYRAYFIVLILLGFLPLSITALFGFMAYRNVQRSPHYTKPLIRRELDRQLTVMVLVQVLVNIFTLLPYAIVNILSLQMENTNNLLLKTQIQLASNITLIMYYVYYANPFYIYICASERFRRQLIHVLFTVPLNRWKRKPRIIINQVLPQL
ncbi:unnamed protein product [Adineta steineri]|uniref:G-protein coupled receptors family 1 profile domain-containing protein n=1 Tax=Adineta steineri TaxID=433720 RepID=A0A814PIH6_9BILA|nr:unnamed protein product [Adineta steineri]CAF3747875.1 unnamed protein product [Adineta steineri]